MQDKYRIVDKIASGGMAEVYLARSTAAMGLGKFVAIKRILPHFSSQSDFVELFKMEARIAMQLQHRNLVSIHDFGLDNGHCFLVMELVAGLTLRQVIQALYKKQKVLSIPLILHIISEVATGLHYAHEITIHRDVSPRNIMMSFNGDIKVIDFGVAKLSLNEEATQPGGLIGKIGYMSPEQIQCQTIDIRSDIFSLGVVLYELLTQRRPFRGKTETAVIEEMKNEEIPWVQDLNPAVDSELAHLVHKALRMDPSDRFGTMDVMARELQSHLNMRYPEFTSSDLMQFMKREFQSEMLSFQEKLFGYSKSTNPRPIKKKEDMTATLPLPEPEEVPAMLADEPIRQRLSSRVVRKKFHIRYAYQVSPELNAMYEQHSLHGYTKKGALC